MMPASTCPCPSGEYEQLSSLIQKEALLGVDIRDLPPIDKKEKVACIGAGPSSLACALTLRMNGFDVTVFEAREKAGGMLTYGIPEYKLPQKAVEEAITRIENLGIKIVLNTPFSKDFSVKDIKRQAFRAVYLGLGLWGEKKANIPGDTLKGVISALPFLSAVKQKKADILATDKVIVIGGGETAMDCGIEAKLSGAESVTVIYGNTTHHVSATKRETLAFAHSLGIGFTYGFVPGKIVGKDGRVFIFKARGTDGTSELTLRADKIILAFERTFERPNGGASLVMPGKKLIETNDYMTAKEGFFAGGDAVNGESTVRQAIADGKAAATKIMEYFARHRKEKEAKQLSR